MANTTNYNWETPDDTDLVKDGAAAIRTLGSSIDTTTKNLNPQTTTGALAYRSATANVNTALPIGTANQVLRVNSGGTAPEWATTADQTPLTTKGDLFGFDTADARIPIGTNGQILTADSTQSLGLKWASPSAASFVGCVLTKSTGQTIANSSFVDVTWDTEDLDTNGFHSTVTNTDRITIPSGYAGKYLVISQLSYGNNATGDIRRAAIYKNTTQLSLANVTPNRATPVASYIADMGVGDYFKTAAYQDSGGNVTLEGNNFSQGATIFQVIYLGA
jgi:hypothetical protein